MNSHHYSVTIFEGREFVEGYVFLEHGTRYTLELSNTDTWRCDAEVSIDGQKIGTWRINEKGSVRLERPVHDTGRFTFYQHGTKEAARAGIVNNDAAGIISVVFKPERRVCYVNIAPPRPFYSGGTGLSGHSEQRFSTVEALSYEDPKEFVTIKLCLMADTNEPRPLFARSASEPQAVE